MQFSPELFDTICERIAEGESLRDICKDDGMPNKSSVFRWVGSDDTLRDQYARAREVQADVEFDEIREIADTATPENVNVARLQIDARKWRASKMRPKVYGDKLAVGGDDSMPPIKTEENGAAAAKVLSLLERIAERS